MTAYGELEHRFERLSHIDGALGALQWDRSVMMPPAGERARAGQLATLSVLRHELLVDPRVADLIGAAEAEDLDPWQAANVREMRRRHAHAAAVPADLIEALTRAASRCEAAWRTARRENDLETLLPLWKNVLSLSRHIGEAKGERLGLEPYDALLDTYDPGRRVADIDPIFDRLAGFLGDFLPRALDAQDEPLPISGTVPIAAQEKVARRLMKAAGFPFDAGRLDTSAHPFTGGVPEDVRITTRWDEHDFTSGLMAVLHETGHALYTSGLPRRWRHQPVGEQRGMTVHESQSLLVEMQAGRSPAFMAFLAPMLRDGFGVGGEAWEAENLHRYYTRVEPGLIRVDADEVTYPLHVILRYRLERDLIEGRLDLSDLPDAWSDGLDSLLGVRPPDHDRGCLQDIHWFKGSYGYFPTYTLGALAAAQLWAALARDEPEVDDALARGDFSPIVSWLRDRVHAHGCRYEPDELIEAASGAPLSTDAFEAHLAARYLRRP